MNFLSVETSFHQNERIWSENPRSRLGTMVVCCAHAPPPQILPFFSLQLLIPKEMAQRETQRALDERELESKPRKNEEPQDPGVCVCLGACVHALLTFFQTDCSGWSQYVVSMIVPLFRASSITRNKSVHQTHCLAPKGRSLYLWVQHCR